MIEVFQSEGPSCESLASSFGSLEVRQLGSQHSQKSQGQSPCANERADLIVRYEIWNISRAF